MGYRVIFVRHRHHLPQTGELEGERLGDCNAPILETEVTFRWSRNLCKRESLVLSRLLWSCATTSHTNSLPLSSVLIEPGAKQIQTGESWRIGKGHRTSFLCMDPSVMNAIIHPLLPCTDREQIIHLSYLIPVPTQYTEIAGSVCQTGQMVHCLRRARLLEHACRARGGTTYSFIGQVILVSMVKSLSACLISLAVLPDTDKPVQNGQGHHGDRRTNHRRQTWCIYRCVLTSERKRGHKVTCQSPGQHVDQCSAYKSLLSWP